MKKALKVKINETKIDFEMNSFHTINFNQISTINKNEFAINNQNSNGSLNDSSSKERSQHLDFLKNNSRS
jgi:hypothetical protein